MRKGGEWRTRQRGSPRRSVKRDMAPPLCPTSHIRSTASAPSRSRSASYSLIATTAMDSTILLLRNTGRSLSAANEGGESEGRIQVFLPLSSHSVRSRTVSLQRCMYRLFP
ncbi:hypothetical protein GW17_00050499 [Ensete ventricosum]|nr:hypothetical protein GW17_00050499 [Ensete ventricosum]RZR87202.1 hypothetical protein BHM03_00014563 [Ensete ventricosum]